MPKRIFLTLATGLLILTALAGCRGNPRADRQRVGEAAINLGAEPRSLDPSLATDIASTRAIMCFTRGLTVLDDQGKPQPELAESWQTSPDGLTWDFTLRPARWSNGEPVTADDFVYTWTKRVLNPQFSCEYAYNLFYIKGAREFYEHPEQGAGAVFAWALDPTHLRVTLSGPTPFFLSLLAHNSYYPVCRKVAEANPDWAKRAETYVGCGPFVMKAYTSGNEIAGEKNPAYWDAANVKMNRLTLRMIEQEPTELIAFENGEIDGTGTIPRPDLPAWKGRPEYRHVNQFSTNFLNLNTKHKPLDDPRVRQALALAIDRAAIVKNITQADERPAFFLTPPELYKNPPAPQFKDAQYEEARRLLAEAGFPGGKGFPTLQYLYNEAQINRQIAQVLQETWRRELGINLTVQNQEFKVLIENRRQGNFDIARAGWVADFADPINFLEIFDSKSDNNDSHWADPQYDQMLASIRAEADPAKREQLLKMAEGYLIDKMPLIPLDFQNRPYLVAPRLEGYTLNPMDLFNAARLAWAPEK